MSKTFVLGFLLISLGGSALWVIAFQPQLPQFSFAQGSSDSFDSAKIESEVHRIDEQIAAKIRELSENGVNWNSLTDQSISTSLEKMSQSTVSATVSTTPEQFWKTLREEGSQAVLANLAKNAEVSVNSVSTNMVNEARYQYCTGVVKQYESLQKQE